MALRGFEVAVDEEVTFGFSVTEEMEVAAASSLFALKRGDLLVEDVGNAFVCLRSGTATLDLHLTEQQQASLKPVAFVERGLGYELVDLEAIAEV